MKNLMRTLCILTAAFFLLSSCQKPAEEKAYPLELKWVNSSVEYQRICLKTYQDGWKYVKARAAGIDHPWAVVMDIDETVLSNAPYQQVLFEKNQRFPYYWDEWVKEARCATVPGAGAFIDSVHSLGSNAHIAFISDRTADLTEASRRNLQNAGVWREGDVVLCKSAKEDTKAQRRKELSEGSGRCAGLGQQEIIAQFGDQLGDFTEIPNELTRGELNSFFGKSENWRDSYFVLPNPMYGSWYRDYGLNP